MEATLKKAREEKGLSFGFAGQKTASEVGFSKMPEVGYYITWFERTSSDSAKSSIRYVFFPFDKILIVYRISKRLIQGEVKEEERFEIFPAYGRWLPSFVSDDN